MKEEEDIRAGEGGRRKRMWREEEDKGGIKGGGEGEVRGGMMGEVKEKEEDKRGGGESSNPTHNRKPHVTVALIASMCCIHIHIIMNWGELASADSAFPFNKQVNRNFNITPHVAPPRGDLQLAQVS